MYIIRNTIYVMYIQSINFGIYIAYMYMYGAFQTESQGYRPDPFEFRRNFFRQSLLVKITPSNFFRFILRPFNPSKINTAPAPKRKGRGSFLKLTIFFFGNSSELENDTGVGHEYTRRYINHNYTLTVYNNTKPTTI